MNNEKLVFLSKLNKFKKNKINLNKIFEKNISKTLKNDSELIIVTTAITRLKLHNISFNNYAKFIPKNLKISWVINIDYIDINYKNENKKEVIKNTIDNIKNIFKDYNITFYITSNEKGNFNLAVRTVVKETIKLISRKTKYILYLEDDWYLEDDFNLVKLMNSNYDAIRLYQKDNYSISFQPSLTKPFIWYYIFYYSLEKNKETHIDPEKICQKNKVDLDYYNINFISYHIFKDIGREYIDNETFLIRGWWNEKENDLNLFESYIDYDIFFKTIIYQNKLNSKNINKEKLLKIIIDIIKKKFNNQVYDVLYLKLKENYDYYYNYYKNTLLTIEINNFIDLYNYFIDLKKENQILNCNEIGA